MNNISITNPDLINKFPDAPDPSRRFRDVDINTKSLVDSYYSFINAGNFQSANQLITDNLILNDIIINASNFQYWYDMILSLQRYYLSDFQKYIINAIEYKGDWQNNIQYGNLKIVHFNNLWYITTRGDTPIGISPDNTTYWAQWATIPVPGEKGASGLGLSPRGVWNSGTQYYLYDLVSHSNKLFFATRDNINSTPNLSSNDWAVAIDIVVFGSTTDTAKTTIQPDGTIIVNVTSVPIIDY